MRSFHFLFIVLILSFSAKSFAQLYNYGGLKYYMPYLLNPAFTEAEKTVQFDLLGYKAESFYSSKGAMFNGLTNLSSINSSIRLSYGVNDFFDGGSNFSLAYAYHQKLSDKFGLKAGVGYSRNNTRLAIDTLNYDYWNIKFHNYDYESEWIDVGVGIDYKGFTVGVNSGFTLSSEAIFSLNSGRDSIVTYGGYSKFELYTRYKWTAGRHINLSPFGGINMEKPYEDSGWGYGIYTGIITDYKDLIGLGLTIGDELSLMFSAKLFNSVRLNVVLIEDAELPYNQNSGWMLKGRLSYAF